MSILFEPRPNPHVPRDQLCAAISTEEIQAFADRANEIGGRAREETGIRSG